MPESSDGNRIAIVGMSGRFPRSPDLDAFWKNLRDGVELISFYTDDELLARGVAPELVRDPSFVKAASTLEGIDAFDAAFFGFLPRAAEIMDPQHRLLMECAWETLEDSGYDTARDARLVGLYAGAAMNGYLIFHLVGNPAATSAGYVALQLANDKDYMPSRISYALDLRGPSCLVQSACSTSLAAIHIACQSLLNHECDMALAGGVAGLVHNRFGYQHVPGGIFSPDGHCRSFDADGQGTIFGSGLGMVALKRLEDARADGDTIRAVILGSAVNNDGSSKVGYTAPSVDGQAEVIAEALANAGVPADTISYVEGHGTATQLGDPIEVQALTKAFRASTDKRRFCALGSVKSNLGHLDAAAGVTGVVKTVLALAHRQIPPSLHFRAPNPRVDWEHGPFFVNTQLAEWPRGNTPRRAGVSSFGIGGTNAHVILEEAPEPAPAAPSAPHQLVLLSARTEAALDAMTVRLADHLEAHPELVLADVAHTLRIGRRTFSERRAFVVRDRDDAIQVLRARDPNRMVGARQEQQDRPVVFLFPGQGSQHPNMGRELYEHEPVFRKQIERCAARLLPLLGRDLRELLYPHHPQAERAEGAARELAETRFAQPALFAVEFAMARLWRSWGLEPRAMLGHSLGEYVAACVAGVLSLDDALALVAARGRLMQAIPAGAMLAVPLPAPEVKAALVDGLSLAAINGPANCVVSGPTESVDALARSLAEQRGVRCRRLAVSHAFHSSMLEPMMAPFAEALAKVTFNAPKVRWVSNLTGTWITEDEARSPAYWLAHLRQPVRFSEGLAEVMRDPNGVLLEVGPGQTLSGLARRHPAFGAEHSMVASSRHVEDPGSERAHWLETAGRMWIAGVTFDWLSASGKQGRRRVPLPTYPFERTRHWIDAVSSAWALPKGAAASDAPAAAPVVPEVLPAAVPTPAVVPEVLPAVVPHLAPAAHLTPAAHLAPEANVPAGAIEALMTEQLRVLSLQIDVLRRGHS
ncbi:type I polyketide synthase [Pendulispora albinea]|uniref:Type I polyketide synthase n=1 Tax=Pendulispora albinea TaxID=2741071 RepID=A0ABZ2MA47_9BACT